MKLKFILKSFKWLNIQSKATKTNCQVNKVMLIYSFTTYSSSYYIWDICDTKVINGSLLRTRSQD